MSVIQILGGALGVILSLIFIDKTCQAAKQENCNKMLLYMALTGGSLLGVCFLFN